MRLASRAAVELPMKPTRGIVPLCCARAASGHAAAAPPSSVMKSRRLMVTPAANRHPCRSLAQAGRVVLGAHLNHSESKDCFGSMLLKKSQNALLRFFRKEAQLNFLAD